MVCDVSYFHHLKLNCFKNAKSFCVSAHENCYDHETVISSTFRKVFWQDLLDSGCIATSPSLKLEVTSFLYASDHEATKERISDT